MQSHSLPDCLFQTVQLPHRNTLDGDKMRLLRLVLLPRIILLSYLAYFLSVFSFPVVFCFPVMPSFPFSFYFLTAICFPASFYFLTAVRLLSPPYAIFDTPYLNYFIKKVTKVNLLFGQDSASYIKKTVSENM